MVAKRRGGGLTDDITFEQLVSLENIWQAWKNFVSGKWGHAGVRAFWLNVEKELALLYHDLNAASYAHGPYHHFVVSDTKRRDVYVATVRDKVVHQILADYLQRKYRTHFFLHSFSAQRGKGLSAARNYALSSIRRLYAHRQVWVAKLDVQKYFSNINHNFLMKFLARRVTDPKIFALCRIIIESFGENGIGLPLGNLTSQWFANIYLHELDWYAKHIVKIPYYLRYNDDVILIGTDRQKIMHWSKILQKFAFQNLRLTIPASKISIAGLPESVDILGFVANGHRVWVRYATVQRAQKNINTKCQILKPELLDTVSSYFGTGVITSFLSN